MAQFLFIISPNIASTPFLLGIQIPACYTLFYPYISQNMCVFPNSFNCLSFILYYILQIITPLPSSVSFNVIVLYSVFHLLLFLNFRNFTQFSYSFFILPLFPWTEKAYFSQVVFFLYVYGYLWTCYITFLKLFVEIMWGMRWSYLSSNFIYLLLQVHSTQ